MAYSQNTVNTSGLKANIRRNHHVYRAVFGVCYRTVYAHRIFLQGVLANKNGAFTGQVHRGGAVGVKKHKRNTTVLCFSACSKQMDVVLLPCI